MSTLQNLTYDTTRNIVTTTRGEQLPIKIHRGWKYINYQGKKIGLNTIQKKEINPDPVFEYWFNGGFRTHPCPAMDYWIYRHRLKNRITTHQYKKLFNIN